MPVSRKYVPLISLLWTLFALASSLLLLLDNLSYAAWNGINFVMGVYLFLSCTGALGLIVGFFSAFSEKILLAWITSISASVVSGLSAFFALGFIFGRESGVPLSDPLYLFGLIKVPILGLYIFISFCCAIEVLLYFPKTKNLLLDSSC